MAKIKSDEIKNNKIEKVNKSVTKPENKLKSTVETKTSIKKSSMKKDTEKSVSKVASAKSKAEDKPKKSAVAKKAPAKTTVSKAKAVSAKAEDTPKKSTVAKKAPAKTAVSKAKAVSAKAEDKPKKSAVAKKAPAKTTASKAKAVSAKAGDKPTKPTTKKKTSARKTVTKRTVAKKNSETSKIDDDFIEIETAESKSEKEINAKSATDVWESYHKPEKVGLPPPPAAPEIPDCYGDTRVVLLARDPEWMYCYWEISDAKRSEYGLTDFISNKRLVLRIFRIDIRDKKDLPPQFAFDVPVPEYANDWYVRVPQTGGRWCAELCVFDRDNNNIMTITRSNLIETPRSTMSPDESVLWMRVDDETFDKVISFSGEEESWEFTDFQRLNQIDRDDLISESHMHTIRLLRGSEEALLRVPITSINAYSSLDLALKSKDKTR